MTYEFTITKHAFSCICITYTVTRVPKSSSDYDTNLLLFRGSSTRITKSGKNTYCQILTEEFERFLVASLFESA